MFLFRHRSDGTAHWSKDHIEHLRLVHFVLVAAAITGIVLSRTPNTTELEKARHQLRALNDAFASAPSHHDWDYELVQEIPFRNWLVFSFSGKKYTFLKSYFYHAFDTTKCPDSKDLSIFASHDEFGKLAHDYLSNPTINDFEDMWNMLGCTTATKFSVTSRASALLTLRYNDNMPYLAPIPLEEMQTSYVDLEKQGVTLVHFGPTSFGVPRTLSKLQEQLTADRVEFITLNERKEDDTLSYVETQIEGVRLGLAVYSHPDSETNMSARQNILRMSEPESSCDGNFSQCFKELKHLAAKKPSYRGKEIFEWLDGHGAETQPMQLELLGVRFPAEDQAYWGMVILFIILCYLWLHLLELAPRLADVNPGLEVPWIGLYSSDYSRVMVFLSVVVLPLSAMISLARIGIGSSWWNWIAWGVIPFFGCLALSVLCWLKISRMASLSADFKSNAAKQQSQELRERRSSSA